MKQQKTHERTDLSLGTQQLLPRSSCSSQRGLAQRRCQKKRGEPQCWRAREQTSWLPASFGIEYEARDVARFVWLSSNSTFRFKPGFKNTGAYFPRRMIWLCPSGMLYVKFTITKSWIIPSSQTRLQLRYYTAWNLPLHAEAIQVEEDLCMRKSYGQDIELPAA